MMDAKELRRLLELAAKAVGYDTHHRMNSDRMLLSPPVVALVVHDADGRLISTGWNPAEDDGDSRRLEVDLAMNVFHTGGACYAMPSDEDCYGEIAESKVSYRDAVGCKYAATRLAVLRVAAAIGESI